jgi:hypothetical protein
MPYTCQKFDGRETDLIVGVPVIAIRETNRNGRIYPLETVEKSIERVKTHRHGQLRGQFGMKLRGSWLSVDQSDLTHVAENLRVEGDNLVVDIRYPLPHEGPTLREAYESGAIAFRTAGVVDIRAGTVKHLELYAVNQVPACDAA